MASEGQAPLRLYEMMPKCDEAGCGGFGVVKSADLHAMVQKRTNNDACPNYAFG